MTRLIINLNKDAYEYLRDAIPRAIKSETIDQTNKTATIKLDSAVILKSYDDGIILDLGMKKIDLVSEDFESIAIAR